MRRMFSQATDFNQCLSSWAYKTRNVDTNRMFENSGFPVSTDPDPIGPWCQGDNDQCFEFPHDPSNKPSDNAAGIRWRMESSQGLKPLVHTPRSNMCFHYPAIRWENCDAPT
jgi:hypothetical protein